MVSLGGGEGAILCVAGAQDEARLRLALNISNAMEEEPVWAWPAPVTGDEAAGMTLGDAVAERLFTRILVFGGEIAEYLFGAEIPEIIAAARVHVVPGLERLGQDREAKR
ncbi:MAG: hypothetical protein GWN87_08235, partial [Desulfuromonadales bacterium]|nr:hypothetical protein [Desulfuromonadales bacterium]